MPRAPIARAVYLKHFINEVIKAKVQVYDYLHWAKLPSILERDDFFALAAAMRFFAVVAQHEAVKEFGFRAAQRLQSGDLSPKVLRALDGCPSLYEGLMSFSRLASWECSNLRVSVTWHGSDLRIKSTLEGGAALTRVEYLQWLQNMIIICIVRQFAGPNWYPATIAFEARVMPGSEAQSFFPGVRFLTGESTCWIDVPCEYLNLTLHHPIDDISDEAENSENLETGFAPDFLATMEILLRPYINDGYPKLEMLSEVVGLSVRTMQRYLEKNETTYSELVQHVRHGMAKKFLLDRQRTITEIAHAVGYSDHSHFTRAFRRIAGISPHAYRTRLVQNFDRNGMHSCSDFSSAKAARRNVDRLAQIG